MDYLRCDGARRDRPLVASAAEARPWAGGSNAACRCAGVRPPYKTKSAQSRAACVLTLLGRQAAKPRTQLLHVARSAEGKQYLHRRVQELQDTLLQTSFDRSTGAAETALLGSMLHLLGDLPQAEANLRRAVNLDANGRYSCQLERVRREREASNVLRDAQQRHAHDPASTQGKWLEIDRVDAAKLSKAEFVQKYALPGVPVIITGLVAGIFAKGVWTRDRIRTELGEKTVVPRKRVARSPDWAALEDAPAVSIAAFLDLMQPPPDDAGVGAEKAVAGNALEAPSTYLFDWNLPGNAASMCAELRIPDYFADDFLQHLPDGSMYKDAWPSLFVGPRGTRSGLHVDAFGSNFWMAVMEGKKHWTLFRRGDTALLGPSYVMSLDPAFAADGAIGDADGHARDADAGQHLLSAAGGWDFVLEAGEVLFVPAGCAHTVVNCCDSVAISANYIDASNLDLALDELIVSQAEDTRLEPIVDTLGSLRRSLATNDVDQIETNASLMGAATTDGGAGHCRDGGTDCGGIRFVPWDKFKKRSTSTSACTIPAQNGIQRLTGEASVQAGQGPQAKRPRSLYTRLD